MSTGRWGGWGGWGRRGISREGRNIKPEAYRTVHTLYRQFQYFLIPMTSHPVGKVSESVGEVSATYCDATHLKLWSWSWLALGSITKIKTIMAKRQFTKLVCSIIYLGDEFYPFLLLEKVNITLQRWLRGRCTTRRLTSGPSASSPMSSSSASLPSRLVYCKYSLF